MAELETKMYQRSDIVLYAKVKDKYHRMKNFKKAGSTKNTKEYTRQYVDEDFETSDVVGYSQEIPFDFDRYTNNPVHDFICEVIDDEIKGATIEIARVNFNEPVANSDNKKFYARVKVYSVYSDDDGGETDSYSYTGKFKSKSALMKKVASSADNWKTITLEKIV